MPTGSADGPVLVICTGDGPLEMVMDPLTGKPVHKDSDDRSNPCSWAKGAVVTTLVLPVSALAITGSSTAAHLPAAPFVLTAAQETGLPPSTGPPSVL
ncbi:hypothetical protein [Tropicimonas sediminicola]|nr:hypothetical protein [Tropicimonas sediminicola]